jgi:ribosome biogenesis GTPase
MTSCTLPTTLQALGWDDEREASFDEAFRVAGLVPARVASAHREHCVVWGEFGELIAEVAGRLRHEARGPADFPATGDWVAVEARPADGRATVHAVLPRRTRFSRKAAGAAAEEQLLACNLDVVLLVTDLDRDFSLRRLERYLVLARQSGAEPVIVLSKADLCPDVAGHVVAAESVAGGARVVATSAVSGAGLDEVRAVLGPGVTAAAIGSSGVGKSALVNALLGGEAQATQAIREWDGKGRHTTSHRELFLLPCGGLLADNPGLREVALWAEDAAVDETFDEVAAAAALCRFRDCTHGNEPGCAVRLALDEGRLDAARVSSYLALRSEAARLARRAGSRSRSAERARTKAMERGLRERYREKFGRDRE